MARLKYFPHLAGSLILASAALVGGSGLLDKWEPDKSSSKAALVVYPDKLAQGLPTVCNGITKHVSTRPVVVGDVWTEAECKAEETQALEKVQIKLASCFKILPPQSVFDAATSHAWNNGTGATCGSLAMKAWNQSNWNLGCTRIAYSDAGNRVWSYVKTGKIVNGKPEMKFVQGLANRREDEMRLCKEGLNNVRAVSGMEGAVSYNYASFIKPFLLAPIRS